MVVKTRLVGSLVLTFFLLQTVSAQSQAEITSCSLDKSTSPPEVSATIENVKGKVSVSWEGAANNVIFAKKKDVLISGKKTVSTAIGKDLTRACCDQIRVTVYEPDDSFWITDNEKLNQAKCGSLHPSEQSANAVLNVQQENPGDEVKVGETVTFTTSESTAGDGEIADYVWDTDNDGIGDTTGQATVTKTFDEPGEHTVTVIIHDDLPRGSGASDTASATVQVRAKNKEETKWADITNGKARIKKAPEQITLNKDFQMRLQAKADGRSTINNQELHIFLNGKTIGRWDLPVVNSGFSKTETVSIHASCGIMYEEGEYVYFKPGQKTLSLGKTKTSGSSWSGEMKKALNSIEVELKPPETIENQFVSSAKTETPSGMRWISPPNKQKFKVKVNNQACVPLNVEIENVTINGDRYSYQKTKQVGVKESGTIKVEPRITGEQMYEWDMTPDTSTIKTVPANITYKVRSPTTGESFTRKKSFKLRIYNTFKHPNNNFGITNKLVEKFPEYRKYKIKYNIGGFRQLKQEANTVELYIGKPTSGTIVDHGFFRSGMRPDKARGATTLPLKNGERIMIRVTGWKGTGYRNTEKFSLPKGSSDTIQTRRYTVDAPVIPSKPKASVNILSERTDWGDRINYRYQINNPTNFWAVPYFVKENGERIEVPDNRLNSKSGKRSLKIKNHYTEYHYNRPDKEIQIPKKEIEYLLLELQATGMSGIEGRKTISKDRIKITSKAKSYDPQKDNVYLSGDYSYNNQDISNFSPSKIPDITGYSLDGSKDPDKYDLFIGNSYYKKRNLEIPARFKDQSYVPVKIFAEPDAENKEEAERCLNYITLKAPGTNTDIRIKAKLSDSENPEKYSEITERTNLGERLTFSAKCSGSPTISVKSTGSKKITSQQIQLNQGGHNGKCQTQTLVPQERCYSINKEVEISSNQQTDKESSKTREISINTPVNAKPGKTISIDLEVPENRESKYQVLVKNPEGRKILKKTYTKNRKTIRITPETPGKYTVQVYPTGTLQSIISTITGPLKRNTFNVKSAKPEWISYCQKKGFEAETINGKINCIQKEIEPNYFQDSVGEKPQVAESLCQDLLGYNYNQGTKACEP